MANTPLLGLTLPVTGTLTGTWGDVINTEITTLIDSAIAGTTTLTTDANVTLTTTVSATNQAREAILLCTGARTAIQTITAPAQSKTYIVINATTGGYSVKLVGAGPTTGVTIVNGSKALVAWNGSDFVLVSVVDGPITGTTGTFTANSSTPAVQITQTGSGNALLVEDSANPDSTPFVIDASGRVGVGITSPGTANLYVGKDLTGGTAAYGVRQSGTADLTIANNAYGFINYAATSATASTLASYYHYSAFQISLGVGSSITNQIGYFSQSSLIDATLNYAFFASDTSAVTTGKSVYGFFSAIDIATGGGTAWGFYAQGTAPNYMGGSLGIGSSPATFNLYVVKPITTGTAIRQSGTVDLSTVTTTATGYQNVALTTATAATLNAYYHFRAEQSTFGAGSTVNNQYGFVSIGNLIGATINYGFHAADTSAVTTGKTAYGFYSAVNAATGGGTTWGFYAQGTADNRFNGQVGIGITPTAPLHVSGNVIATGDIQATSYNGGQLAGLRNKLINGNMGIAQRGTAAVTTSAAYGPADRWRNQVFGDTFSTTQGSFVSGDTLYDTGGAQSYLQVAVTSVANTANFSILYQRIEDVRILAGQTVTVSFWARVASGTPSIGVNLVQNFGTGGAPTTEINGTGQAQALTTTWTKYTKTFTLGSLNGKTLGTDANSSYTALTFWFDAGATYNGSSGSIGQSSKTVSIAQVQLEIGAVATPFEQRPIGMELALCQRYFEVVPQAGTGSIQASFASGLVTTATNATVVLPYKVNKRATPTLSSSGTAGSFRVYSANGTDLTATGLSYIGVGLETVVINVTVGSGLVAGNATLLGRRLDTSAQIEISAEL